MKFRAASLLSLAPLALLQVASATAQVQSTTGAIAREPLTLQQPLPAGTNLPSGIAGSGNFLARVPLVFDINALVGYDSNTLATSDNEDGSAFLNTSLDVSYVARSPRASLLVYSEVGVSYYFDRPGRDYDLNVALNGSFSYRLNSRATFSLDAINLYQPEPEFQIVGSSDRRTSDYFYLSDRFGLSYRLTPRVSTVTSYTPGAYIYRQDPSATTENRFESLFAEEVRFLVRPNISLLGEYRFGYIDYFYINGDSYSNFILGGIEAQINPRLSGGLRAGVEFREFVDGGEQTEPLVEGNLSYVLTRVSTFSLSLRYGLEQGDLAAANSTRTTLRVGASYVQNIGRRLSVSGGIFYTHSDYNDNNDNQTVNNLGVANTPIALVPNASFTEETIDLSIGARYAFNRRISAETGYTYSTVSSDVSIREYDRHRVFGGFRFTF